ncbi:MAG: mechanosensitive ion channel family protein [Planctomycetota bacterium]
MYKLAETGIIESSAVGRWAQWWDAGGAQTTATTGVILLVAIGVYLFVSQSIRRLRQNDVLNLAQAAYLRVFLRWGAFLLAGAALMQAWGVLANVWAAATAAVTLVAIGFFAVWSVLSNVLCSLILLTTRPFHVGERIRLLAAEAEGRVMEVNLLHTVLRNDDGETLLVPNNMLFQQVVLRRRRGYKPPEPIDSAEGTTGEPPANG